MELVLEGRQCFSHGQLYVALSRVTSMDGIRIYSPKTCKGLGDNFVENVVYQELLQDELIWRRNMQVGGPLKPVCIRVQSTDEPDSESDEDNEIYQF